MKNIYIKNLGVKLENPLVSIIILNWKGWEDTLCCLESVYQIDYPNYNVIVVNNGSEESVKNIEEHFSEKKIEESDFIYYTNKDISVEILFKSVKKVETQKYRNLNRELILIKNKHNCGFAEGNNIGVEYALKKFKTDYILLLNNDTLVDINFLKELVKVGESDKNIGSVQSLLLKSDQISIDSLGQKMLIWGANDIRDNFENHLQERTEIFGACAASALYRADLIKEIGLFDKDFFVLLEDVDLSWRIRLKGMKSILASNSIVYHKRGISNTISLKELVNIFIHKTEQELVFKWYHESKNWQIIFIRYYPMKMIFISMIKCPKNFFLTFILFFYSSIKLKKIKSSLKLLFKNKKIRNRNKENKLLANIQKKWIGKDNK